jgi:hypothetical protein
MDLRDHKKSRLIGMYCPKKMRIGSWAMLNYKQVHYFWRVAKAGSIARAAEQLSLSMRCVSLPRALKKNFPRSLDGAPALIPAEGTTMRGALSRWLGERQIEPTLSASSMIPL